MAPTAVLVVIAIICAFMAFRTYKQGRRVYTFWIAQCFILLVVAALLTLPVSTVNPVEGDKNTPYDEIGTYNGMALRTAPYEVYKRNGEQVAYTVQNRGSSKVQMYVNEAFAFVEPGESKTILHEVGKKKEEIHFSALPEDDTTLHIRYTIKQNKDA